MQPDRREAAKRLLVGGLCSAASLMLPSTSRAGTLFNSIAQGNWDGNEIAQLRQAIAVVDARLTNPAIIKNAQEQDVQISHGLTPTLISATALNAYPNQPDYQGLLWRQLSAIRNAQVNLFISADRRGDLPTLAAQSGFDQVKISFDKNGVGRSLSGEFRMVLNLPVLANYPDPVFWASVIAHEVCHSLGHRHEDRETPTYSSRQMITFQNAFWANGRYARGMYTPFACANDRPVGYCQYE